jgi:hypothetical protein
MGRDAVPAPAWAEPVEALHFSGAAKKDSPSTSSGRAVSSQDGLMNGGARLRGRVFGTEAVEAGHAEVLGALGGATRFRRQIFGADGELGIINGIGLHERVPFRAGRSEKACSRPDGADGRIRAASIAVGCRIIIAATLERTDCCCMRTPLQSRVNERSR